MKRLIDYHLDQWKTDPYRKPLLLRGARQVGKTYAARRLGSMYEDFVEINLEFFLEKAARTFQEDLNPKRILHELSLLVDKPITPGKTLLFLDEIQAVPNALLALRYFYEMMPELHVIAAGSLLDFAIEEVGIPVGRVESLYMYPMSFIEFLAALDHSLLIKEILTHRLEEPMSSVIHEKIVTLVAHYCAIGGMPQAVTLWKETQDFLHCMKIYSTILDTYRQDFGKYARKNQIKYVELVFNYLPRQLGTKFKYSTIDGEYRKRELAPALDLLVTAGIAHKIFHSSGQGIPLGAQINHQDYKVNFLDVGLSQAVLDFNARSWFLDPITSFINKGQLVETFIGQELLAYSNPIKKNQLYYWHREQRGSQAKIDYLIQIDQHIIPVEIKSGSGTTLKSLHIFLDTHPTSPYGLRFSTQNYSHFDAIHSYPLYAL